MHTSMHSSIHEYIHQLVLPSNFSLKTDEKEFKLNLIIPSVPALASSSVIGLTLVGHLSALGESWS